MIKIGNFKKPTEQPDFQRGQKERHDARSGHSGTLLYFAYGSNMNRNQMAFRCPDAEVAGSVRLEGYRLAFRENGGGVGVATVLPEPDSFVEENTLTVNIARLRRKLEAAGLSDYITTKKGLGYLIE